MDVTPEFLRAKYDEVEFIDQGAYGRVYKCTRAEVTTAVKILDELDPVSQARFAGEVDILRSIDHENIVKVLDAGETDGHHWYESEYASQGHFGVMHSYLFYSDLDRVKYFRQICLGVRALHELDPPIIHRDLKPSNILVFEYFEPERHSVLKIADFGIAAIAGDAPGLTKTGTALGTPDYMAPERRNNPRVKTPQSDIYSLGITFLEACTGSPIPSQENLNDVPEILRPIIEKMIRRSHRQRYQSIVEVLDVLNSFSFFRLLHGREPGENESGTMIFNVNKSRELENAFAALVESDAGNVRERLAAFERKLDRLGDAHDHEADAIMRVTGPILAVIDEADREALLHLIERFLSAADQTSKRDFFSPVPDMWAHFLADTFRFSSYRPTKYLCLEGLAKFLAKFGTPWTKEHLYLTIKSIEDPSYIEHLAVCLREVDREDVAGVLDGVSDPRDLDLGALVSALRGPD
ncbi:MAG: serine/threonine-protein kinase [Pyrinomonadaceae bacterium]